MVAPASRVVRSTQRRRASSGRSALRTAATKLLQDCGRECRAEGRGQDVGLVEQEQEALGPGHAAEVQEEARADQHVLMGGEKGPGSLQVTAILTRPETVAEVGARAAEVLPGVGGGPVPLVGAPGRVEGAAVGAGPGPEAEDVSPRVADQAPFQEIGGQGGQDDDQIERGARQELIQEIIQEVALARADRRVDQGDGAGLDDGREGAGRERAVPERGQRQLVVDDDRGHRVTASLVLSPRAT